MSHKGALLLFGAAALAPQAVDAKIYVNDPLTADPFMGRGSKGGKFGDGGWLTVDEPDSVWWEIPDALVDGKVEYTVTGLSVGGSLSGNDHDIFTLYQAPPG